MCHIYTTEYSTAEIYRHVVGSRKHYIDPGVEVSRGGGGAQPPPRPGAQRSSLLPTARLERRRRQQASLKEKEMIVSLALPAGAPPDPAPTPA